jgi:hypothetical protein
MDIGLQSILFCSGENTAIFDKNKNHKKGFSRRYAIKPYYTLLRAK